jgi:carbon-monoxide dehydrogenase medium subunit
VRTVAAVPPQIEVTLPTSPQEAKLAFAESEAITVVGGATIVMPALRSGRLQATQVMLLGRAGMDGVRREGERLRIGAAAPLAELADMPEPLAGALAGIADPEIRAQATIAGNVCAPPGGDAPRGDLQGPLIALGAQVRWTDGSEERTEPIETFLERRAGRRLVLEIELRLPELGAYAALRRPHSHGYTALAVSGVVSGGELRLAATGLGPHGVRLLAADNPIPVGPADPGPLDDAVASDWYRREMVPVLVRRCLIELGVAR